MLLALQPFYIKIHALKTGDFNDYFCHVILKI